MLKNNHIHQERKILHKVKRQWVILSAVTLLGTAGITSINVNAASSPASDTKSASSLANTTAGYSNAAVTISEAASSAINRLSSNISAINSYAKSSTVASAVVANAQSAAKNAQSAYDQIKVANVIASAANTPGGTLQDGSRAASQASSAFTTLMDNLANTDIIVGNISNAVTQIENPSGSTGASASASYAETSQAHSTTASSTSSSAHSNQANATASNKSAEVHSSTSHTASSSAASSKTSSASSNQASQVSAAPYTGTKATSSAVSAAKDSIATAKRQVKLAKTSKAKAEANQLLKRAQKNLLIVQNNYNYKYYYYFDGPFDTVTTKKNLYVYSSKHLTKKYRVKKVPKGTTISIFKVITDDNSAVFQVTGGNYITSLKSFFNK